MRTWLRRSLLNLMGGYSLLITPVVDVKQDNIVHSAEYVLGLTSLFDRATFEAWLISHPDLQYFAMNGVKHLHPFSIVLTRNALQNT